MKSIGKKIYSRGKSGKKYCRLRIPTALREAYPPNKTHICRSLGTADLALAEKRLHLELAHIDAEFEQKAAEIKSLREQRSLMRLKKLSESQLKNLADYWVRQTLLYDELRRDRGLDDDEFDEMGEQLMQQRAELGRMLATGRPDKILPAMHSFIRLCGLDVDMSPDESRGAGKVFLAAVVTALDSQLQRHGGAPLKTDAVVASVATPKEVAQSPLVEKEGADWEAAFGVWRDYVPGRPKSTTIATQTPWRELQRCAAQAGIKSPQAVTPELMREFVNSMSERGLTVVTINERLAKIKALFKVIKGKGAISVNPAVDTIGLKENSYAKRVKRRLPFDADDVQTIFSSAVFNEAQLRSQGQAGEATYWIPVLMYYTGARTEEIAGLALDDIKQDSKGRRYFNLIDRPSPEDEGLFDDGETSSVSDAQQARSSSTAKSHARILKNAKSIRKVPVAKELIELGLLRYIDHVREQGHSSLFPALKPDWHGKLSGAFSKFFGRYKKQILGMNTSKKVLYSFRHSMKDAMTRARIPKRELQRILGHASGDGQVTDGYGTQDVSLDVLFEEFQKIEFFRIPAHPWEPGKGFVTFTRNE
ncbi:MAG: tyrosine-type recombinase/integrase [Burkholderiaceae bacterium]